MTVTPAWVLVVDDDATDRMLLFRLLEHAGHRATVADNGTAALELLRREPFDLVLLDLLMPDPDGFAVLQTMKSDRALGDIPVIVVSAVDELEPVLRCLELGADDYLAKPTDPVLLQARITASLDKKRLREREAEYFDVVGHVVDAAAAVAADTYEPSRLDPLTHRADSLGDLARVFQQMASRVVAERDELRLELDTLRRQNGGTAGEGQ